jgi:DNA-binding HxlR family transcriptional regulator
VLEAGARVGQSSQYAVREVGDADYAVDHQFRAGVYVLSLFSRALNVLVLRALASGPMRLAELRKEIGGPAQTTLRGNLGNLIEMGALEKRQNGGGSSTAANALTPVGGELLLVADAIETWLSRAPDGPIRLESELGKAAIKALVGGWGSTMLRALAARPFSLTELDNLISAFSYPSLERRLAALRLSGCLLQVSGNGGGTPYAVTDWLRQGMAPMLAALRCERRQMAKETAPLTRIDVETILLLAVPLATFPADANGVAQLTVHGGKGSAWHSAGVRLVVVDGQLVSCTSKLEQRPESWIRGSAADWLDALVIGNADGLEAAGDPILTRGCVDDVHRALFAC